MRSPGVIYRRYRQIKKKILYDTVIDSQKRKHCNCVYGKEITYTNSFGVEQCLRVCNYGDLLLEGRVEICTNAQECNAFANKWTKDKIVESVEKELSDPKIKKEKYPELSILEWSLDKDLNDAIKNPGFFGNIIVSCIEFLEKILKYK